MNERTRYDNHNTLVTIRDGNVIYFGISRCNEEAGDCFNKSFGRMIARNRALKALTESSPEEWSDTQCLAKKTGRWGLRGAYRFEHIKDLLTYFQDTDARLVKESGDYRRFVRNLRENLKRNLFSKVKREDAPSLPTYTPSAYRTNNCDEACSSCCGVDEKSGT